jgi:hypothetical protein
VHEEAAEDVDAPVIRYELENLTDVEPGREAGEEIACALDAV